MRSVILSYGDVQIYQEDLQTLEPGEWLNDTIIEFMFEYYEANEMFKSLFFCRPCIVHLMSHSTDISNLGPALPPELLTKDVLFLPINDNQENTAGGTHWSLLVYVRRDDTFLHYDSMTSTFFGLSISSANEKHAKRTQSIIYPLLGASEDAEFKQMETPKQENGYDCGVYVILIAKLLAERLVDYDYFDESQSGDFSDIFKISESFDSEDVTAFRNKSFALISDMATQIE